MPDVPVAVPAAAPVVPVAAGAADESLAPDEIVASVRTNFASADAAAALLAAGAADVPVVPAAVEPAVPAVPAVPVAPVLVAAGVLALAVFAAEFDGAARRHPVTVTVFSLLDALGCGDGVVCGVGVCAVITAVAHAAIAAHKLICIVFFIRPPAALPVATVGPSAIEPDRFTATVRLKPDTTRAIDWRIGSVRLQSDRHPLLRVNSTNDVAMSASRRTNGFGRRDFCAGVHAI